MANYEVDFDYSVPEWTTITVANAKDKADAEDIAQNEFDNMYPEAIDVRMTDVREVAN